MPASDNNPGPDEGFGVYIHWPFCASMCPYCDFNSHVAEAVDHRRWRTALLSALNHFALETSARTVTSVFFGGGTPSYLPPQHLARLTEAIGAAFSWPDGIEATAEANPGDCTPAQLRAMRAAGFDRLSIGVQSFDDAELQLLGRRHSADDARAAVRAARAAGFADLSIDLMLGLPEGRGLPV